VRAGVALTVTTDVADPPGPVQLSVYMVEGTAGVTARPLLLLVAPPVLKLVPVQLVAFVDDQVSIACCPWTTEMRSVMSVAVGVGIAVTVTGAWQVRVMVLAPDVPLAPNATPRYTSR
jgi:hypothetical protein